MEEHAGVTRAREYLEQFTRGDLESLEDFYSEGVVWHVGGNHPLSGDYETRDALFDYFRRVRELSGGTLTLEAEEILASDRHTAMFTRVTGQRDGKTLDVVLAQVFRTDADGRWSEYWALADDQDAVDRFWS